MLIILILTTLFSGLMAGLFYSWSVSVTPGLAKVGDENYLKAFQSMNRAIINPVFLIVFMGQVILLLLLSYLYFESPMPIQSWYIIIAAILYITGVMTVTIFGNIPMNNSLEALHVDSMSHEQMASFRQGFENKWNNLNMIRTICSLLSSLFLIMACLQYNGK